jgi:hypothetical protein
MPTTNYSVPWDGPRGGFPSGLTEGINNGQAAGSDPIEVLESACLHLAGSRKLFIPGPVGFRQATAATKWFFYISRENYSKYASLVMWISATDRRSYASVRVVVSDTSYDTTTSDIATGLDAKEVIIPEIVIGAGDNTDTDTAVSVTITITPGNDDTGITADFVLWSIGMIVEPMHTIGVVT